MAILNNKYATLLALGDSYTIGESIAEKDRWPVQLVSALRSKGFPFEYPRIIAKTGWTTGELDTAITKASIESTFDYVSLSIGVNNQYRGYHLADFRMEFEALLTKAIGFADNKPKNVIVVSIPDWGVTPFASDRKRDIIAEDIDSFNCVKKEVTLLKGANFINITEISRKIENDISFVANDKLHYSSEMYSLWVDEIIKTCF